MQIAQVMGERRVVAGKNANERLRRRGLVPAIVYGHGEQPEPLAISQRDLELALHQLQHVVKIDLEGKSVNYLIKDVQFDHLQRKPIHVDLMRVDAAERVRVKVALEFKGTPEGARQGGVFLSVLTDLDVECRVLDIPELISINVEPLQIGQSLHVRELPLPEGVVALTDAEALVCAVRVKRDEAAPVPAEGAANEPEVFGRVAKEQTESKG